jgi:hypothetical protein
MALVRRLTRKQMDRNSLHEEVEATYSVFAWDDRTLLQIDTYGRADREIPGKKSQTIQIDEAAAHELFDILKTHFGFR